MICRYDRRARADGRQQPTAERSSSRLVRGGTVSFTRPLLATPESPSSQGQNSVPRARQHSCAAFLAHSPCRPPASRLWASTASETRRILTANRIDMWSRCFDWSHLHFGCRCAAQQHLNARQLEPCHASAYPSEAVRKLQRSRPRSSPPPQYPNFGPRQSA